MDALRNNIHICTKCPLSATVKIRPVAGQGLQTARIMLIKEKISDSQATLEDNLDWFHKRFIKNIFEGIGLSTDDLYVTSIIKCNCDKVMSLYVKECKYWLEEEIKLVNPKVIIVFGSAAQKIISKQFPHINFISLPALDRIANSGADTYIKELYALIKAINE